MLLDSFGCVMSQTWSPIWYTRAPSLVQVQTIGFLSYLQYHMPAAIRKPYLVLGPLSTLPNWMSEFKRWCPSMTAVMYHGDKEKRAELRAGDLAPGAGPSHTVS